MPNIMWISVCKYLRLLRGKVDIALQSIKQTSYKGTIDWEHNAPTNLAIEVNVYKNMKFFLILSPSRNPSSYSTSAYKT